MEVITIGPRSGLHFELCWRDDYGSDGPVGSTWGDLTLRIDDALLWGSTNEERGIEPITWSWVELLEFLGPAWRYLRHEQGYPVEFANQRDEPDHPGLLSDAAKARWDAMDDEAIDEEDERLRDFMVVHDLAQGLQGAYPPPVILLRQGTRMLIGSDERGWSLPLEETLATLEQFANQVFDRIRKLDDPRSRIVRERWETRNDVDPLHRFTIISGWSGARTRELLGGALESANDEELEECGIAARMLGDGLSLDASKRVMNAIRELPLGPKLKLDTLWDECAELMEAHSHKRPYLQGYALARWLREYLKLSPEQRVEPRELLSQWGVATLELDINEPFIDAVAVWSPHHGPAVMFNPGGLRSSYPSGLRVSLAHEIAHLLVDHGEALPVLEVLGGRVPKAVEQRANAFAAEFLLPREVAGRRAAEALRDARDHQPKMEALKKVVDELASHYGTSHETTTWQIVNSSHLTEFETRWLKHYRTLIPTPNEEWK